MFNELINEADLNKVDQESIRKTVESEVSKIHRVGWSTHNFFLTFDKIQQFQDHKENHWPMHCFLFVGHHACRVVGLFNNDIIQASCLM